MPQIERWGNLPEGVRQHLIERMRDRAISVSDLNELRLWIETRPQVPKGDWYKDFGSFRICSSGSYPKTFLLPGRLQRAKHSDHRQITLPCYLAFTNKFMKPLYCLTPVAEI